MYTKLGLLALMLLPAIYSASLQSSDTSLNHAECGKANVKLSRFATHFGEITSMRNGYPWAAIVNRNNQTGQFEHFCGGTLINNQWIVTAGSCISNPDTPWVYDIALGEHMVSSRSRLKINVGISRIILHEEFQLHNMKNDIALLKLEIPVPLARNIRPACIPEQDFPTDADEKMFFKEKYLTYAGKECILLSWAETEQERRNNILYQELVYIFPRTICKVLTRHTPGYYSSIETSDRRFCAASKIAQALCKARPGSPLICKDDSNRYYLHGITSFGPKDCGMSLLPNVYTEVAAYRSWIEQNIRET